MTKKDALEIKRLQLKVDDAATTARRICDLYSRYFGLDEITDHINADTMSTALCRLETIARNVK